MLYICFQTNEVGLLNPLAEAPAPESATGMIIGIVFGVFSVMAIVGGIFYAYKNNLIHRKFGANVYFNNRHVHTPSAANDQIIKINAPVIKQSSDRRYNEISLRDGDADNVSNL